MRHLTKAILILGAGLAAPVMAQDVPRMMAGLWESTVQMNGVALGTVQMCMDASPETMAANLRARTNSPRTPSTCDKPVTTLVPEGHKFELSCTSEGHTHRQVVVLTGDLQSHMHVDMTLSRDGGPGIRNQIDMHRTGECPADMKPGDTKTSMDSNAIANLAQAFAKKPAATAPAQ
jgi:hypothetical protein